VAIAGLAGGLEALGHSVRTVGGGSPRRMGMPDRLRFNLSLARSGAAVVGSDLVVGFDMDGFALRARDRGPRYVVCLKGIMADELRFESGWPRMRFRLLSRLERRNARTADVVMVTSEYSRKQAIGAYGLAQRRVRVVPEGIDPAWWELPPPGGDAEGSGPGVAGGADAGARPRAGGPIILSVARQYRRKNTIALLRAMPAIRATVGDARLRIVGGGPELGHLVRERRALGLEGTVDILGELPGLEALRAEYRRADLFCLPSLQEGFGIAFLEAMASGLAVVACRSAAVPEIVRHGETGLLVPPADPVALAEAVGLLLGNRQRRAEMGMAGRRRARAYGWEAVASRFLAAAGF
jgi:glycosyltransferase involved in cell wall biosynthesis